MNWRVLRNQDSRKLKITNRFRLSVEITEPARRETFSKVSDSDIRDLESIVGRDNILTDEADLVLYSRDKAMTPYSEWYKLRPDVVVLPATTEEVLAIVRFANKRRVPITPRSGGCGFTGNAVPTFGGISLDMKRMNRIVEIDEENLTVTAQAGIQIQELDRVLRQRGYMYADEPTSFPSNLLGGRISTNGISYMNSKFGDTIDQVISLQVVLPYGEVARFGGGSSGKATKTSVGFPMKYLFIGHWGTLGITTEATMRIFPVPEAMEMREIGYDSFENAVQAAQKLVKTGFTFTMLSVGDKYRSIAIKRSVNPNASVYEGTLNFVLMGTREEVQAVEPRILEICIKMGGKDLGSSSGHYETRHYLDTAFPGIGYDMGIGSGNWQCEEYSLPPSLAPKAFNEFRKIIQKHNVTDDEVFTYEIFSFFPKASEVVMYKLDERDENRWNDYMSISREMANEVLRFGGSVSTCHGLGQRRLNDYIERELGPIGYDLMLRIKKTLDPNNIMNPGKMGLDRAYGTKSL
jgi:glycolate oxidase